MVLPQMLYSLKVKGSDPLLKRTLKIKCHCADYSEFHGSSGSFRRFFTSYVDRQDVGCTCQSVGLWKMHTISSNTLEYT